MKKFDPDKQHRHSIRLKNYDYSLNGAYFITLCTYQRECLLGTISDREFVVNEFGLIVVEEWHQSSII
ncbi:hypothetical protein KKB18_04910, partial [bacterium]|nr:hypothetical protein [bacterium]